LSGERNLFIIRVVRRGRRVGAVRERDWLGAAPMRILLIEDQQDLAQEVAAKIRAAGYDIDRTSSIEDTLIAINACAYSLAIVDRRLPDGDGISIVSRMRHNQPDIRILILSALDAVDDRIEGLYAGADDYLTKPFDLDEMIARIRANLRKIAGAETSLIKIGKLTIDLHRRRVEVRGRPVCISRRELVLLEALARCVNCLVSRESLHEELYGLDDEVQERALTSIVSRLRVRLESLDAGVEIRSARALGYILQETAISGELE
jgi:two-component system OmpR family response regulator